jgi:type II secretory pathway pseudopilin PulG
MKISRELTVFENASEGTQSRRRDFHRAAFTMIEIALCLGVIAFALIAIIGVLPRGMTVQRDNREETIINQDATFLMDAIRSGSHGLDDLTNYVQVITIKNGNVIANHKSPYFSTPPLAGHSIIDLYSGERILGLLSTPRYYNGGTNFVTAYMRAISGNASEKPPQSDSGIQGFAFSYRVTAEVTPYITPPTTNILGQQIYDNLNSSLFQLRLTFRWPLLPNGGVGRGKLVFSTMASGSLLETNILGQNYYFIQPSTFVAAP